MSFLPGKLADHIQIEKLVSTVLMLLFFGCLGLYLLTREWAVLLVPFLALGLSVGISHFKLVYLLLWAAIPFSIELDLPGGLSTDFPVEVLMWLSCLLLLPYLFLHGRESDYRFIYHPIFIVIFLHWSWIILTAITSEVPLYSAKFALAKTWYLLCFILIPVLWWQKKADYRTWGYFLFIPLIISVIIILWRHSQYGFSFDTINIAVHPIYRNHVDYACCLGILLPFAWWMRKQAGGFYERWFFTGTMVLMMAGIYFSYTRAAWLCIPLAVAVYIFVRLRLLRALIPLALAMVIAITGWLMHDNRYLTYSPEYEKAIAHKKFDELVSATYRMEDISTVERFYRWVAGYYMIQEHPWLGTGPSTFYSLYHNYVDRHFTTYVSDNPEQSGIHNYYLMTTVEQGLPGILIFLALVIVVLVMGERLYHRMQKGPERALVLAALISFCCGLFVLTLNDTVETDKLGTFFFLSMAIVMRFHGRQGESNIMR